jgi:hypothetical protein
MTQGQAPWSIRAWRLAAAALGAASMLVSSAAALAQAPVLTGGKEASFAINASGEFFGWGSDVFGQLGLGREAQRTVPTQVTTARYADVALGLRHTMAVRADGTLWSWGADLYGELIATGEDVNSVLQCAATIAQHRRPDRALTAFAGHRHNRFATPVASPTYIHDDQSPAAQLSLHPGHHGG